MTDYNNLCFEISKLITERYSTSFTRGIKTLHKRFQLPVFAVYGFVRLADEIVDTFHNHDKEQLLNRFKEDTYRAIEEKVSTNTVLHAFQLTVHQYKIDTELIDAFLYSMEMDLGKVNYNNELYNKYIYGSAEVVGLMCLRIFVEGDDALFEKLKEPARSLGAAFQKVNFLRDVKSDHEERGRVYFPGIDFQNFKEDAKRQIEREVAEDFKEAYKGILLLPIGAAGGVLLAYKYYLVLFNRIKRVPVSRMKESRIRVPDFHKVLMLGETYLQQQFRILMPRFA